MNGIGSHTRPNRGATDDWLTPPKVLNALREFDLDPCCPEEMPWRTARTMLTPTFDGLTAHWHGRVWLNPPYGQETGRWMERLHNHGNGIALIFARTETEVWTKWVWPKASAILFLIGRLHFHYPDGRRAKANAGGPSALVAFGDENKKALRRSCLDGNLIFGWTRI